MPRLIPWQMTDFSKGMNLRDNDIAILPGESKESLGLDYSVPGILTPMKEGKRGIVAIEDIAHAQRAYLAGVEYTFLSGASGLTVYSISQGPYITINSTITGYFKACAVNDEYFVIASPTANVKWKPGWSSTQQWGINTPDSTFTVLAGSVQTKVIDDFTSTTDWTGGSGGSFALEASTVKPGSSSSFKLSIDPYTNYTLIKSTTLDLSMYVAAGDLGRSFVSFSFYATVLTDVKAITIYFCMGAYDRYAYTVDLSSALDPTMLNIYYGQAAYATQETSTIYNQALNGQILPGYSPSSTSLASWQRKIDSLDTDPADPSNAVEYVLKQEQQKLAIAASTWNELKIPLDNFVRYGTTAGKDWSTIDYVEIAVQSDANAVVVYIDDLKMIGGANLWGYYWAAVAFQNDFGNYGPYSDFIGPVYLQGQPLYLHAIPVDTDSQTTARRLAILGGNLTVPMVWTIDNNTDTWYYYNEPDASLTEEETHFYNRKPPLCRDLIVAHGRVWMVGAVGYDDRLIYSESLFYEGFPYRNYLVVADNEILNQVSSYRDYIICRGDNSEYLVYLTTDDPLYWKVLLGAKEGAITPKFLLKLTDQTHVYASKNGLYYSTHGSNDGYFLPKINIAISDYSAVQGAMAGQLAYLSFTDTAGVARTMQIDYRLGYPLAHYYANMAPTSIFADDVLGKVYYTLGDTVYEFAAGPHYLPCKLVTPCIWFKSSNSKVFTAMRYWLETGELTASFQLDGLDTGTVLTLSPTAPVDDPVSLPEFQGKSLGVTLESNSTFENFALHFPITFDGESIGI